MVVVAPLGRPILGRQVVEEFLGRRAEQEFQVRAELQVRHPTREGQGYRVREVAAGVQFPGQVVRGVREQMWWSPGKVWAHCMKV